MQFCSAGAQRRSLALRPLEFSKPATARLPPIAAAQVAQRREFRRFVSGLSARDPLQTLQWRAKKWA